MSDEMEIWFERGVTDGLPVIPPTRERVERMIEATRAEPGCIAYSFSYDVLDDHLIRVFEVFQDEAALAAHRASNHMAEWREAWPLLGIGDRSMWLYRASEREAT